MRESDAGPLARLAAGRCQYDQSPRRWPIVLAAGRSVVLLARRAWSRRHVPRGLGAVSQFTAGQTVRVRTRDEISAMLDARQRSRGLAFTESQWVFCGATLVVDRVTRQMLDDHGVMRPISRAVSLVGASCDAGGSGCGRSCALIWKDEWLETVPVSPEEERGAMPETGSDGDTVVGIRPLHELMERAAVDSGLGGISLPLDADHYAGTSAAIERRVVMADRLIGGLPAPPTGDWFILRGVRCNGRELANPHPCDRRCALLWHRSWLELDDVPPADVASPPGRP